MDNAVLTDHAKKRLKERLGTTKKSSISVANNALASGKRHSDYRGAARKFLDKTFLSYKSANNMRVFNNYVFIFNGNTLITVLPFPKRFQKYK